MISTIADEWIRMARDQPRLAAELDAHSIHGDVRYQAVRSSLNRDIAGALDSLRFRFSCGGDAAREEIASDLAHFRGAPPEVLAITVSVLRLSTRTKRRLDRLGLRTIGEVIEFGTPGLAEVAGAGKKVHHELYSAFRRLTERFLVSGVGLAAPKRISSEISRWIESLDARMRAIISGRLGLFGPPETLEVLGNRLGLTRERVRQLEAKAIDQEAEAEAWPGVLAEKLERILSDAREPLWFVTLPFHDSFFDDFEFGVRALGRIVEAFVPDTVHCWSSSGQLLLSRVSEDDFQEMRAVAMVLARDCVTRRASYMELVVSLESLALARGARELGQLLTAAVQPYVHLARPAGSAESILVAFGRGVDHVVKAILEEAERPLHYSEIHRRVAVRADGEADVRRVHNALNADGFYLFARGTYGLWRHLDVTDNVAAEIIEAAESVVERADRQWHAGEILEALRSECVSLVGDLDFYGINAILTRSSELHYLGRMVWVGASSDQRNTSDRIDIAQACTRFLREAGRPLSRAELLQRLKDWRGIGRHFQLHVSEDVFPVAPGVFGLRSRDLPVSMEAIQEMLECLFVTLKESGSGMHASELASLFSSRGLNFASRVSQSTLYAFAARDQRLQVDAADYVGLSSWEDTRRISVVAASRLLAERGVSPISGDDFQSQMSSLVGRPLSRLDATYALRDNGYTYDQNLKLWVLPPDDDGTTDASSF